MSSTNLNEQPGARRAGNSRRIPHLAVAAMSLSLGGLATATAVGMGAQWPNHPPQVKVRFQPKWSFQLPKAEKSVHDSPKTVYFVDGGAFAVGPLSVKWKFEPADLKQLVARRKGLLRRGELALFTQQDFPTAITAFQTILSDRVLIYWGPGVFVEEQAANCLVRARAAAGDFTGAQAALREVRNRTHRSCGTGREQWLADLEARRTAFQVANDAGDQCENRLQELIRTNRAAAPEARMLLVERFLREERYSEARTVLAKLPHDRDSYSVEEKMAAVYLERLSAQASALSKSTSP